VHINCDIDFVEIFVWCVRREWWRLPPSFGPIFDKIDRMSFVGFGHVTDIAVLNKNQSHIQEVNLDQSM